MVSADCSKTPSARFRSGPCLFRQSFYSDTTAEAWLGAAETKIEAARIVDLTSLKNFRAEFAAIFSRTRSAHLEHERAKAEKPNAR
jgi:hypothetical protein